MKEDCKNFQKWEVVDVKKILKNKEYLTVEDDISFRIKTDFGNSIFNLNLKLNSMRHACTEIKGINDYFIWAPKSTKADMYGRRIKSSNGWENELTADGNSIIEYPPDQIEEKGKNKGRNIRDISFENATKEKVEGKKRIVFLQVIDDIGNHVYKFFGIYQIVEIKRNKVTYERIDTKVKIIRNGK